MNKKTKPKLLNFKYCECGCHCFEADFMGLSFSIFICMDNKYNVTGAFLRRSRFEEGIKYPSYKEAEEAAEKEVVDKLMKYKGAIKGAL